jgi:class 3 adenylate cyclase
MAEPTSETVTFLFSDVEGSTRLVRELGSEYRAVQTRHQQLVRDALAAHGGREIDSQGDSFFVAFTRPRDAVLTAVAVQRALAAESWAADAQVRVRIGIHTGPVDLAGERYVGLAVHRAARISAAAHGGQILLSQATVALLEDEQDLVGVDLRDLGEQPLKDFQRPVRIFQVVAGEIPSEFPPLRTGDRAEQSAALAVRASDADRDRTVADLREQTVAGRLTLEDFAERTERAYSARSLGELERVRQDLPATPSAASGRRRPKRLTVAILSNTQRTGRWRLPQHALAFVLFGDVDLDLRQAELGSDVASITAFVLFGNIDVYVPEGVEVDFVSLGIFGHRREWGRDVPPVPGTPLLRVRVLSLFGTSDLWRVPAAWVGRSFRQVIKALRRGEQRELPPGPG